MRFVIRADCSGLYKLIVKQRSNSILNHLGFGNPEECSQAFDIYFKNPEDLFEYASVITDLPESNYKVPEKFEYKVWVFFKKAIREESRRYYQNPNGNPIIFTIIRPGAYEKPEIHDSGLNLSLFPKQEELLDYNSRYIRENPQLIVDHLKQILIPTMKFYYNVLTYDLQMFPDSNYKFYYAGLLVSYNSEEHKYKAVIFPLRKLTYLDTLSYMPHGLKEIFNQFILDN